MKKIVLVCSLLLSFFCCFSSPNLTKSPKIALLVNNNQNCNQYDSIVNITTINNLINVSGVIVYKSAAYVYIATSYKNYKQEYNYEIIFNNFLRKSAQVVGVAKEDEILLLRVAITIDNYCVATISKSKFIDQLEKVNIIGKHDYRSVINTAYVSNIGVCSNCDEFTYKNYYYTTLSGEIEDYFFGAGGFDSLGNLLGIIVDREEVTNGSIKMLDIDKLIVITYNLISYGKYEKNYIKYNLLNVNSLTNHEKYLYSLNEDVTKGVLISTVHYLNYFTGGLNQGMVIVAVENNKVNNRYELDNVISQYEKGSVLTFIARNIFGKNKEYKVKV